MPRPSFLATYAGDTLWALMIFWAFAFVAPRSASWKIALAALAFCFAIEFSQLYQADWANAIRSHTIGALVFGRGFLASDLICYSTGIFIGWLLQKCMAAGYQNIK